jgi:hypothetical protein
MRIVASPETVSGIRDSGGLLFVWRASSRGPRLVLTILDASLDPPPDAFDYRRVDCDPFTLFFHPTMYCLPDELWVELRGHRTPHVRVYWNGLAYVA